MRDRAIRADRAGGVSHVRRFKSALSVLTAQSAFPPYHPSALIALTAPLALSAVIACAKMAPPPGGPTDHVPPILLSTLPESVGVYPGWDKGRRIPLR
jgi:hypothetical protein